MIFFLKIIRFTLPLLIIAALFMTAQHIMNNPPEAERRAKANGPLMSVDVLELSRNPYQVNIQSYGRLKPRTQSMLVAQVAGQVTAISPFLREGGFFEKGDELLTIDPRDYVADVKIAEASLMDSRQSLAEEKARSEQALRDWKRLGNQGKPSDLVLRKPQLLATEARVISASSSLTKARLNLERTKIIAPFAGRVMRKMVDVGQVVSPNSELAEIYASDYVEVRLPLRNRDLAYIQLPESYRFDEGTPVEGPEVSIRSELGGEQTWLGRIVRTESTIDETARQLHVVAQIDKPFDKNQAGKSPLKIGQYVTAELKSELIKDALVIPNSAIYQGSYVYIVEQGVLQRRDVDIAWQNDSDALINDGLNEGDKLVLTSLGQVTSGVRVEMSHANDGMDDETGSNLSMHEQGRDVIQ